MRGRRNKRERVWGRVRNRGRGVRVRKRERREDCKRRGR